MASAELNSQQQPLFWSHLVAWLRAIPRAALLSMVGPSLLCVLGYLGWRYYGAPNLDKAYYGLKQENIHITNQPAWLKKANVLEEVYKGGALSNLSLLDSQMPANLARVFDAHPCVRKTHRIQKMAGGLVKVDLEYRIPVAMVCFPVTEPTTGTTKDGFLAVDSDSVNLDTSYFTEDDVRQYILIYPGENIRPQMTNGKPFGDVRVEEAVKLCTFLMRFREAAKIERIYVYPAPNVGKSRWWMEITTENGPRFEWGSAPGLEGLNEPTAESKLSRLLSIANDPKQWAQKSIKLSTPSQPSVAK